MPHPTTNKVYSVIGNETRGSAIIKQQDQYWIILYDALLRDLLCGPSEYGAAAHF